MSSPDATPLYFVVLRHEGIAEPHFDVMLETAPGSQLATWRSPVWPIEEPTELTRLRDHRRAFLEFEGKLSNDRGQVRQVDSGACEIRPLDNGVLDVLLKDGAIQRKLRLKPDGAERWTATAE